MPTILAIETSTEVASVALLHGDLQILRVSHGVQTHSETILPMVSAILAEADIPLSACDAIAFGAGPGAFTGVRTACGIVQGLAFGADLPVVPIVTLAAMAHAFCTQSKQAIVPIVPIMDARMGEVYWAQYHWEDGVLQEIIPPTLSTAELVSPRGEVAVCGNGVVAYRAAFSDKPWVTLVDETIMPNALDIAQLAIAAVLKGEVLPAEAAQPLYLRNKVALTTSERQVRDAAKGAV